MHRQMLVQHRLPQGLTHCTRQQAPVRRRSPMEETHRHHWLAINLLPTPGTGPRALSTRLATAANPQLYAPISWTSIPVAACGQETKPCLAEASRSWWYRRKNPPWRRFSATRTSRGRTPVRYQRSRHQRFLEAALPALPNRPVHAGATVVAAPVGNVQKVVRSWHLNC